MVDEDAVRDERGSSCSGGLVQVLIVALTAGTLGCMETPAPAPCRAGLTLTIEDPRIRADAMGDEFEPLPVGCVLQQIAPASPPLRDRISVVISCAEAAARLAVEDLRFMSTGESASNPLLAFNSGSCDVQALPGSGTTTTLTHAEGETLGYPQFVSSDFLRQADVEARLVTNGERQSDDEDSCFAARGDELDLTIRFRARLEAADVTLFDDPSTCLHD